MGRDWAANRYRANLIDMHIPDWDPVFLSKFDPKRYLDLLQKAKVETAYIYTSSCLGIAYWPTPVGHMHEGLGGRDIIEELTEGIRAAGMDVVLYFNYWSKWAYLAHPDWRITTADGRGTAEFLWKPGRYGVCCLNSPYRDFVLESIRDLCSRYTFDGLWIDMLFWPHSVCYCGHCRQRYDREVGGDIPRTVNWRDPAWVAFQRLREKWLADFTAEILDTARDIEPDISFGTNHAAWSLGWQAGMSHAFLESSDYLAGDFYGGPTDQSFVCKLFRELTGGALFEFMTSRCPDLTEHTTTKTPELLSAHAFSTLANNGRFLFIDAIDPSGTLHDHVYDLMGAVFANTDRYQRHFSTSCEACADVAIYINFESLVDLDDSGKDILEIRAEQAPLAKRTANTARTLIEAGIPFTVITDRQLADLGRYQVVILSDLAMMSPSEIEGFRDYVWNGGGLYASGSTSLLDADGNARDDFMLGEVFGVSYDGQTHQRVTYMAPTDEGAEVFSEFTPDRPVTVTDRQAIVRVRDAAHVLATSVLPYIDPDDLDRFSSAISDPPHTWTGRPAVTVNRYGDGTCVYAASPIEKMSYEAQRKLFARVLALLESRPRVFYTDAPKPVEITVFHQPERNRFLVAVVNFQSELPNLPIRDVSVRVNVNGRQARAVTELSPDSDIAFDTGDGYIEFTVPEIQTFRLYAITHD